ncbi:urocanate hydratase-like [Xenia sp. Carnegie-2017]|uniref:urocanate hydratase-like n=1 Tax=Xenia sp. Carnegie-2017 TaxID=2897299 RepID=UPI001F04DC1F|nr:urocanate hydratase-like [Xenia sp. Carnegie-2017]
MMSSLTEICSGLPLDPLPQRQARDETIPHAPKRNTNLTEAEKILAVKNALRYFPPQTHKELTEDFVDELNNYGHIYMYRFRPLLEMKAYNINEYPCKCQNAAAIMLMIMNNLDPKVAQFPHELVTYGGNGQVFSNWAQFRIVMHYLSIMTNEQTLVMYSGHPLGLFPSSPSSPRAVITNGMMIPNHSSKENYDKLFALGVTMYGQMTAGSYCYIGPQGIVHGTMLTVLNAARRHLHTSQLAGRVFVTSGLGGMRAQAKAATICGCIGVIAEINKDALHKRYRQGWLMEVTDDLEECIERIKKARKDKKALSLGYHGNVVDLWERLAKEDEMLVELGSDQSSLHNPYNGGYYPVGMSLNEANKLMNTKPDEFKKAVQQSLKRHVLAINTLSGRGMFFFDYGNAFLLEARRAGADVVKKDGTFRYPSYVQDIMGDIFSLGFGPFRWVCTSGLEEDLQESDKIAADVLQSLKGEVAEEAKPQYVDNIEWIKNAHDNKLVVGSQARILYADRKGRVSIAVALNKAIKNKRIKAAIVISRDHHDVSGTDSLYRETSNIYDGSKICADMAVQNVIGDSFRGATWVSLHNGGGVGWGEVINGGFGLVLDGSEEAENRAKMMLSWDVSNGVARRCWSGNENAKLTTEKAMAADQLLKVTVPFAVENEDVIKRAMNSN